MLISVLTFLIGLVGALLVAFGSWLVYPPAGYIVGGLLCLVWSFMSARRWPFGISRPAKRQRVIADVLAQLLSVRLSQQP